MCGNEYVVFFSFLQRLSPGEQSLFVSFCNGRLGNQICSFSVLFALAKRFNVRPTLVARQESELRFFFNLVKERES